MNRTLIKNLVLSGVGIAVVFAATFYIKIPNAIGGYFNLGDGFILLFSSILNPMGAFLVGGLGSAMADVVGGYPHYFIPTLLIKGIEAVFVSVLFKQFHSKIKVVAFAGASIWMVIGYFFAKWLMKDSMIIALSGIPSNLIQGIVGVVIAYLLYPRIVKLAEKIK